MELEERIQMVENELAQAKAQIRLVLVELKDLILRDQNLLADNSWTNPDAEDTRPRSYHRDRPFKRFSRR